MANQFLRIGYVLRPQGIRGELKVQPLTDDVARFEGLKRAYLEQAGSYREIGLQVNRVTPEAVYLYISGCHSRDAAEALRECYLCVAREDAIALPANSWFICDLIGMQVQSDGVALGGIREVIQTGAVDVYCVEKPQGGHLLFPALQRLIRTVDVERSLMDLDAQELEKVRVDED